MVKSIIKELIIVLLLLLAIILVLGVFLYDYMPMNKIVPKSEQYKRPESIEEELKADDNTSIEDEVAPIVYEIDGTDLTKYEKTKDYKKGKVNPFSPDDSGDANQSTTNEGNSDNNSDNTNKNSSNSSNKTTNDSNSVGNYLPNTGTK